MAKRKGLLFPLLYFMAEFWLTSQQVLRIGEWHSCILYHIAFFFFSNQKYTDCPFKAISFPVAWSDDYKSSARFGLDNQAF